MKVDLHGSLILRHPDAPYAMRITEDKPGDVIANGIVTTGYVPRVFRRRRLRRFASQASLVWTLCCVARFLRAPNAGAS